MSKARNLSDLLDANGDVVSGSLDNVPPADLVNDTTPQLGGNLDLNGSDITGTGNVNVTGTITATNFVGSDLVNDTTPQLGGALDTNGNNINFGDNVKAQFGASNDLQISHEGTYSLIRDNGAGPLYIRATDLILKSNVDNDDYAKFLENGAAELYYSNSKKLATTSTGVTVTGTVSATSFSGDGSSLTGISAGGIAPDNYTSRSTGYVNETNFRDWYTSMFSGTVPANGYAFILCSDDGQVGSTSSGRSALRLWGPSIINNTISAGPGGGSTGTNMGRQVWVENTSSSAQTIYMGGSAKTFAFYTL